MLKWWLALFFKFSLNPQMDFAIWITHSLREGLGELARLKTCMCISKINSFQMWRLGGIYSPLGKTSRCHTGHIGHVRYDLHCANGN